MSVPCTVLALTPIVIIQSRLDAKQPILTSLVWFHLADIRGVASLLLSDIYLALELGLAMYRVLVVDDVLMETVEDQAGVDQGLLLLVGQLKWLDRRPQHAG